VDEAVMVSAEGDEVGCRGGDVAVESGSPRGRVVAGSAGDETPVADLGCPAALGSHEAMVSGGGEPAAADDLAPSA
jgi:hypothetical protein